MIKVEKLGLFSKSQYNVDFLIPKDDFISKQRLLRSVKTASFSYIGVLTTNF